MLPAPHSRSDYYAAKIIVRYEWLGDMPKDVTVCYGLWPSESTRDVDDLLGVVCFGRGKNRAALASIADYDSALILMRGACSMRAGRNGASFLISRATKALRRDYGIRTVLAYSDPAAGERGTIYKALNWNCLGVSQQGEKKEFSGPAGETFGAYDFSKSAEHRFYALGWNGKEPKYQFLRRLGYRERVVAKKVRWMHSEE